MAAHTFLAKVQSILQFEDTDANTALQIGLLCEHTIIFLIFQAAIQMNYKRYF